MDPMIDALIDGAIEGGMFLLGLCLAIIGVWAFVKITEIL